MSRRIRINTSLRPTPELYPLVAMIGAGGAAVAAIVYHHLSSNPEARPYNE